MSQSVDLFGQIKPKRRAIGSHESTRSESEIWLTPPEILDALGPFDLDPCACSEPRPWPTARVRHYTREDNGLLKPWFGRVWMNPPYGGPKTIGPWLKRMAHHRWGTCLVFARTETDNFHKHVWDVADAILFLKGRLAFHYPSGIRAGSAGAPSCLVAYGEHDAIKLSKCGLAGKYIQLIDRQKMKEKAHAPNGRRHPDLLREVPGIIYECGKEKRIRDLVHHHASSRNP